MKIERSNACERSATRPSAARIETSAISSGTRPATTAPKTSSRTINAAGSPNLQLAVLRSRSESWLKSWSRACVAGDRDGELRLASARSTTLDHRLGGGLLADDEERDQRRVPVARDERASSARSRSA